MAHPTPTPTPTPPKSRIPRTAVHLASRASRRPEFFSLALDARHPRAPTPLTIYPGGGGRSWRWEPAHVRAPLAGPPARYRREPTLQLHVTNVRITGVTRIPAVARRTRGCLRQSASTAPSQGSRCGTRDTSQCPGKNHIRTDGQR